MDNARGLVCTTISYNSMTTSYNILIKSKNCIRTPNIVDICDVDEVFSSGKATKVSDKPENNVSKTPVVDGKEQHSIMMNPHFMFHEPPEANIKTLERKFEADELIVWKFSRLSTGYLLKTCMTEHLCIKLFDN